MKTIKDSILDYSYNPAISHVLTSVDHSVRAQVASLPDETIYNSVELPVEAAVWAAANNSVNSFVYARMQHYGATK